VTRLNLRSNAGSAITEAGDLGDGPYCRLRFEHRAVNPAGVTIRTTTRISRRMNLGGRFNTCRENASDSEYRSFLTFCYSLQHVRCVLYLCPALASRWFASSVCASQLRKSLGDILGQMKPKSREEAAVRNTATQTRQQADATNTHNWGVGKNDSQVGERTNSMVARVTSVRSCFHSPRSSPQIGGPGKKGEKQSSRDDLRKLVSA
jgi:hypothetical protein